jgi:hypothetical protein
MALLFVAAAFLGQHLVVENWLIWSVGVVLTLGLVLAIMLATSLPPDLRGAVLIRVAEMAGRFGLSRPGIGS